MIKLKFFITSVLASILILTSGNTLGQNYQLDWVQQMGGANNEAGTGITLDPSGNIYVCGTFDNTTDFDPGPGVATLTSLNVQDAFVAKYDPDGNFIWVRQIGGPGEQSASAISLDPSGNVLVTGLFRNTVDFDPGPGVDNLTAQLQDVFILKLDNNGDYIWAKKVGGASTDRGTSITSDGAGNVYVTGELGSLNADFDPNAGTLLLSTAGSFDIFVLKLDTSGNLDFAFSLGSTGQDGGFYISVDDIGNIFLTGYFRNTVDFDPGTGTIDLTAILSSSDIFVLKLDASTGFQWVHRFGFDQGDLGHEVSTNAIGDVKIRGIFRGTVDFDPGLSVFNLSATSGGSIFDLDLDTDGNFINASILSNITLSSIGNFVDYDGSGNLLRTGGFTGSPDFDPGPGTTILTSAGGDDFFIQKLIPSSVLVPAITSFTPTSGPIGTTVTITGTNFSTTLTDNIVFFGATKAMVTTATPTQLTVTVPVGATYQPISVLVGGLTAYSGSPFLVTFPGAGPLDACAFATSIDFLATASLDHGLAVSDLDADGKVDLVTNSFNGANTINHTSIYRNTSTPGEITITSFLPAVNFTTLERPVELAIGDLDGDGKPDIVVAHNNGNAISIYKNISTSGTLDGTSFGPRVDFVEPGISFTDVAIADLDLDGKPELIAAPKFVSQVFVYRNVSVTGSITTASFSSRVNFPVGTVSDGKYLAVGDLDNDGKPEIVVTLDDSDRMAILKNTTTSGVINASSFAPGVEFVTGRGPEEVKIGDLDGDSKSDIVVANWLDNDVSVFRNTTTTGVIDASSFAPEVQFLTGQTPDSIEITDVDGDGKPDLIVPYYNAGVFFIAILRNTSTSGVITTGSFAPKVDFLMPKNASKVVMGDFDGDGKPDMAALNYAVDEISILRNTIVPPAISSFTPTSGSVGTSVTITGTDFSTTPADNTVKFNGITATVTGSTATSLTVTVPAGATTGTISVTVQCKTVTSTGSFIMPPSISSFSPTSGPIGTTVVINGTDFSTTPSDNTVQFNGVAAYVVSSTSTTLTVIVPPGATTGLIAVTVLGNTETSSTNFSVIPFLCPPGTRQGGDLDTTFDPLVESTVSFTAVELQSTGQSIVAAPLVTISGSNYQGLLRFNTNGTLDNSFTSPLDYFPDYRQLKVMPNDQILVVEVGSDSYIRRLNADGSLDNTFNSPGYYASTMYSIGYQSDNKVLVSLYDDGIGSDVLYRLNADGSPDNSFTPVLGVIANVILKQPDGKILAAGPSGVIRVEDSGSIDPTFTAISALDGDVTDMVIQSNGKIVLVGTFTGINGFPTRNIARLNSDGSIDTGFLAGNGFSLYAGAQPNSIKLLAGDNLLVAGEFTSYNDEARTRLLVLNADGSLQCSFDPQAGPNSSLLDAAVQADGKILIVGGLTDYDGTPRIAFARVNGIAGSCVPASERAALVALYNATNGSSWTNKTNWLSADENTWFGVAVTGCRVTNLFLTNNNLTGSIPTEIGDLPELQTLQLPNNLLTGSIPTSIGNLTNLINLDFSGNQLSGSIPATIGNMTSLQSLVLDQNQLTGAIPNSIYSITALRTLELGTNQLTGTISTSISNLTSLEALGLSGNQLSGTLPTELGTLTNLIRLQLAINQFNGNLPASIGNLVNLNEFSVFNNQLSGTVPSSLGNLVNLTALGLSVNQFTGDVPAGIGLLPNLNDVSLRDNDFTSIPTFVSNSFTDLLVYGNKLHFGHLEPNIGKTGFVYSPQDNLAGGVASACEGSTLTISFSTPGTANQYQWYKDGVLIPGATTSTFSKANATSTDAGNYTVQVTNTLVTGLTLSSDPFVVSILSYPSAPTVAGVNICGGSTATLTASGGTAGQYRWYTVATGGTAIAGETNATFTTPVLSATTDYFVAINNGTCESTRTTVTVTVNALPTAPTAGAVSICSGSTATLTAAGGSAGQYGWYTVATGGTAIAGETNATFTTPALSASTDYFVAINNGTCESTRTTITVTVNSLPTAPTAGAVSICSGATTTLTAAGGTAGQYRWYTVATGGTALAGETNATFTTPALSANTDYFVAINNGTCESTRTTVTVTVNSLPTAPTANTVSICSGATATLNASGGTAGQYRWYTIATGGTAIAGQTNNTLVTPVLTTSTSYYVSIDNGTCESVRTAITVTVTSSACPPPVISSTILTTTVGGLVTLDLVSLITTAGNNLDISSIQLVGTLSSGATATINNGLLTINYNGIAFTGTETFTIQACDLAGNCSTQVFSIEVEGDIVVYNAVSPNQDGQNEVFRIENIDLIPETRQNKVSIYNRWGAVVWEGENYNNSSVAFRGISTQGNELPAGTYFYKIEFSGGRAGVSGYLTLKR